MWINRFLYYFRSTCLPDNDDNGDEEVKENQGDVLGPNADIEQRAKHNLDGAAGGTGAVSQRQGPDDTDEAKEDEENCCQAASGNVTWLFSPPKERQCFSFILKVF